MRSGACVRPAEYALIVGSARVLQRQDKSVPVVQALHSVARPRVVLAVLHVSQHPRGPWAAHQVGHRLVGHDDCTPVAVVPYNPVDHRAGLGAGPAASQVLVLALAQAVLPPEDCPVGRQSGRVTEGVQVELRLYVLHSASFPRTLGCVFVSVVLFCLVTSIRKAPATARGFPMYLSWRGHSALAGAVGPPGQGRPASKVSLLLGLLSVRSAPSCIVLFGESPLKAGSSCNCRSLYRPSFLRPPPFSS